MSSLRYATSTSRHMAKRYTLLRKRLSCRTRSVPSSHTGSGMIASSHRKQIVLFLAAVVLPSGTHLFVSWKREAGSKILLSYTHQIMAT